jgi:hypothetical protein
VLSARGKVGAGQRIDLLSDLLSGLLSDLL